MSDLIRRDISEILLREIRDPRLRGLVSVTDVDTSPDLKNARVYVSIMGSEQERQEALRGLEAAKGFVRRELGERLGLRYVPELHFRLDESIERGARILQILKEIGPEEEEKGKRQ